MTSGSGAKLIVNGLDERVADVIEVGENRDTKAPQPVQYLLLPRRIEPQAWQRSISN
jgi:hypothetical protein